MAIINVTDNSFYADSRVTDVSERIVERAATMIERNADIIDIGACSTRPGSTPPAVDLELRRVVDAVNAIRDRFPDIPLSVDTYRAKVAAGAIAAGADIVNDISAGNIDSEMFDTVASLKVPYILTHSRGVPETMQSMTQYEGDVTARVIEELSLKLETLRLMGVCDVIIDPGLGFAKTVRQNYQLLDAIPAMMQLLECPVLIGASRKSMITKPLNISPAEALNGTTVVNTIAIDRGASFLRVHDPLEASQVIQLLSNLPTQYNIMS